jgi:hypothetical protein
VTLLRDHIHGGGDVTTGKKHGDHLMVETPAIVKIPTWYDVNVMIYPLRLIGGVTVPGMVKHCPNRILAMSNHHIVRISNTT